MHYDPANPPFWNGKVAVTPPAGDLTLGQGYAVTVTALQGIGLLNHDPTGPWADTTIRWYADDASKDRIVFSLPGDPLGTVPGERFPTVTDAQGNTSIVVSALGTESLTAIIYAEVASPITGEAYTGSASISFGTVSDTITITPDAPPLYLFNTDQLIDGTYTGDKQFNEVVWSVDPEENPDYAITFDPNPSPATAEDGGRTTQTKMTVYGKNQPTTVTVYAYSADYVRSVGQDFVKGVQSLDFLPASKPPQTGWIELVSLEGNPLAEGSGAPLIQATYRLGNMGGFEPLTWEIVDDSSGGTVSLLTLHGETDVNGVMINRVTTTSTGPVTFTVKVTSDDYGDVGTLDLAFQPKEDVPQLPGQEIMTIHSPDGTTLTIGDTHPLSVDYSGSEVTWIGFPSDRLVFGQTESKTTTVQVLDGPDIPDAAVMTVHFNKDIGAYDYGYLALSFKTKQTQGVVGVTIDKAYALNTDTFVDPTVQSQVIACQLQLQADNNQNQQILLPTDPGTIVASFVNAQGNDLPKKTDGTYYINTGNDGKATFFVGSENPSTFILNTQWQNKDQPASATLTVATNAPPGTWPAPVVPDLGGGTTLQIPSGCPAPTFQVTIPNGAPAGNMALLLNSRIVYRGLVDPAKNPVVEVAYCALDLSGTNVLVYLPESSVNLSLPCSFTVDTTNGNPQTGPCPNLERKLFAPDGLDASQTIGAGDILPPGLSVYIEPYENMEAGDDVITAFFYLQGTDVLSQETGGVALSINNIVVSEPYPVTNDSFKDGSIPMTLPQWAAAGYANGQLQVDYMVVGKKNGTRWSEVSPIVPFNTTIPFPSA
ncbi:hypothetical protein [Mesorhizobium sp. RMAD-H1]|uniref:hypothetical protein n=1 Tax=Mesorhizobium sp. RMAD-H1 TaxID=2587065 RepID=UPI00161A99F3|nr:hypothetical protein [Mesorhizobium sp. RMAD-H1]MBB2974188.1 hypothetical protein [Mesorhizobium sp. RMAD-H1]